MTSEPQRHRVAVTVLVDAEGADARDAHHVAVTAVEQALGDAGNPIGVPIRPDLTRSARVVDVLTTGEALRSGALVVRPAGEA
jgi:hypothetical protein